MIATYPNRTVAIFLALHFAALAAIALLTQATPPLDVIEQLGWARDPQLVYFKHPPLPAWVLWALMKLSGDGLWLAMLAGPLAVTAALALVWRLARRIVDPVRAAIAVLMLEGVVFFSFTALEFNHDVVQLPLWALIGWLGHRAYRDGKLGDWIALGAAAALAMYGKYSTALILLSVLIAFLADPIGRRHFARPGPWIALAVGLVALAPHLWALNQVDYAPFNFPFERAHGPHAWYDRAAFPAGWLAAQVADIAGALILGAILFWPRGGDARDIADEERRYVCCIAFGPAAISLILQLLSGLRFRDAWGAPMWDFIGFAIIIGIGEVKARALARFTAAWCAIFVLAMGARAATNLGASYVTHRGERTQFPGRMLADKIGAGWRAETNAPLGIVVGTSWLAGLVSAYDRDHPSVMIDGDPAKSPWITAERLERSGAVLLWPRDSNEAEPKEFAAAFPSARLQTPFTLHYLTGAQTPPIDIGWAILPPAAAKP